MTGRTLRIAYVLAALMVWVLPNLATAGATAAVTSQEWEKYKEKFLDPAGRIIDNANGNISHSEGQGYGLLLSYLADNRGDFDRIWAFTRTQMLVRDDGLAAWKWDPAANPHISDTNNASDGDLLIAYALALAGKAWNRPDLMQAAIGMANALAASAVEEFGDMAMLKPGATGFGADDRNDGPVVNPSYWVFEALPVMAEIMPDGPWQQLASGGRALVDSASRIGKAGLPPDWVSLKAAPRAADGFPQEFGYNAIRIPLYLLRAGATDRAVLEPFLSHMADENGRVRIVDVATGQTKATLDDAGYRIIPALLSCVADGTPLPKDVQNFDPKDYYPSTLQLLSLSFARRRQLECL